MKKVKVILNTFHVSISIIGFLSFNTSRYDFNRNFSMRFKTSLRVYKPKKRFNLHYTYYFFLPTSPNKQGSNLLISPISTPNYSLSWFHSVQLAPKYTLVYIGYLGSIVSHLFSSHWKYLHLTKLAEFF